VNLCDNTAGSLFTALHQGRREEESVHMPGLKISQLFVALMPIRNLIRLASHSFRLCLIEINSRDEIGNGHVPTKMGECCDRGRLSIGEEFDSAHMR